MSGDESTRIEIGNCASCGRSLRVKPGGLRPSTHVTCKCGQANIVTIDEATLIRYGALKPKVVETVYERSGAPYFLLFDGPRWQAKWDEAKARLAEQWKDAPRELWPPVSDIISVAVNPYVSERNARLAMQAIVERLQHMQQARPWSVELYQNVECAMRGLLEAPFFIFLGMTEIVGNTSRQNYETFQAVVHGLRSDHPRARSGGEWEISSQPRGNEWRSDRFARLLERWVFLDTDVTQTFATGSR